MGGALQKMMQHVGLREGCLAQEMVSQLRAWACNRYGSCRVTSTTRGVEPNDRVSTSRGALHQVCFNSPVDQRLQDDASVGLQPL